MHSQVTFLRAFLFRLISILASLFDGTGTAFFDCLHLVLFFLLIYIMKRLSYETFWYSYFEPVESVMKTHILINITLKLAILRF